LNLDLQGNRIPAKASFHNTMPKSAMICTRNRSANQGDLACRARSQRQRYTYTLRNTNVTPIPIAIPIPIPMLRKSGGKFGVRRQAVFRATPLFERSAAAMLRAKAVPRPAHSAALVTALQNFAPSRLRRALLPKISASRRSSRSIAGASGVG